MRGSFKDTIAAAGKTESTGQSPGCMKPHMSLQERKVCFTRAIVPLFFEAGIVVLFFVNTMPGTTGS